METVKKLMNTNKIKSSILLRNSNTDYSKVISDKIIMTINRQINSTTVTKKNVKKK